MSLIWLTELWGNMCVVPRNRSKWESEKYETKGRGRGEWRGSPEGRGRKGRGREREERVKMTRILVKQGLCRNNQDPG